MRQKQENIWKNFMKEFKYFIDTNIFLRPIVKDDFRKVQECEKILEKVKEGEIIAFTSNIVLAELMWVCNSFYKIKKQEIVKILKGISNFKNLKIIDNFNSKVAIKLYEKHSIKFIDALIASNPDILDKTMAIISYDKDFDKINIIRKEPKQIT